MHVHDFLNLNPNHYALLEEQVRRARSDDGRFKVVRGAGAARTK